jgi:hypothetical protein
MASRTPESNMKPLIIIFSPVRLSSNILKETLNELSLLNSDNLILEFWFYDDNDDPESKILLQRFSHRHAFRIKILKSLDLGYSEFVTSEISHHWSNDNLDRIVKIKNFALRQFLDTSAEALFLVDSDICLHPNTLVHLYSLNLPIVSEVFWTKWRPDVPDLPNVWDIDGYTYSSPESIYRLRDPGQYRVGGLGACTLIRRDCIERGVNFSMIDNLSLWGEDRHFCIRARSIGIDLFADTVYPPLHVYRDSQLPDIQGWRNLQYDRSFFTSSLDERWKKKIIRYLAEESKKRSQHKSINLSRRVLRRISLVLNSIVKR